MTVLAAVFVVIVAALHAGFLVLEMFLAPTVWASHFPHDAGGGGFVRGARFQSGPVQRVPGRAFLTFFLACVIIAGLYGAATVSRRIALFQSLPAAVALALVWLS